MIQLKQVSKDDKEILNNLLQLYLHDISLYFPIDFDSNSGTYIYDDLNKYFALSENYAYLFMDDNNIIGFALVDKDVDANEMVVQEMFILNNYKNKGYGKEAIFNVFDTYKGNWIIKSLPCSSKSENFWNKAIKEYTNDRFEIEHIGRYNRAVFRFNNSKNE